MTADIAKSLHSAALFGAVVRPLLVLTLLFGLWDGLRRAGRNKTGSFIPWSLTAVIIIAWLSTVWTLSVRGVIASISGSGAYGAVVRIVLPIILLAVGAITLMTRSRTVIAVLDAIPLWWLVSFQAYRITGLLFVRLWAKGFLPGYFALPAGIGDTLTGVLAIVASIALWREVNWARRLAYAVNIFGLLDLVIALSMGILTSANSTTGSSPLSLYPLSMVPTFGVPLAMIIHSLSIWQLNRRSDGPAREGRAHQDHRLGQASA